MYNSYIRAFSEVSSYDFKAQFETNIKKRIGVESKEYILGIDEQEYKDHLYNEFCLEPLIIYKESEEIGSPIKKQEKVKAFPRDIYYEQDVYHFTIRYKFSGSAILFKIRPSTYTMSSYDIEVSEKSNTVSFTIKIYEQNAEKFQNEKAGAFKAAFTNLENVNHFATEWNNSVAGIVNREFNETKAKYLKENDFFAAINLKTNKDTDSIFSVPAIKKITIPQPKLDGNKEFSTVPTMSQKIYADILKLVYDVGKSMEKKPSLYQGKDEEGLRDQFLLFLETRYESVTATGETFNKRGKTDIVLKYSTDNSNLFIAECKFWKGPSEFHKAIDQLFDRYLTWRDSKVALMFFVNKVDFTAILETVKNEATKHRYFTRKNGANGESSFSFIYHLPNDTMKEVYLEIMLFHFDLK